MAIAVGRKTAIAHVIAIVVGIGVWIVLEQATGQEAWDDDAYWFVGYPIMLVVAGLLGYWVPRGFWRWPIWLISAQAVWAIASNSGQAIIPLIPLMIFLVLFLPCFLASFIGFWLARRQPGPS
jgi:peptidoglycan/LPS O-acetylase OafA/YrhL